ncbi:cadherin-like domain-containing protein [Magnetospira sp. QH-2]|uniref:cadherin-like domain-containing protein n=1 Tax=Magnetospira sp. (strain QH-2) TaxID=1288970 RepID=UPI0003E814D6|nr:cadherin-like domain-containing protein [Magnetospira sp. QH-2]CCQ75338.1 secreted protein of unknown function [Magnetospira sp. QH-2]
MLAGSADADGDILAVTSIDGVSNGTLVDNGDGSWTFTPDADWNGDLSFSYTVVDGEGGSSTADLDISVASVNDGPTTTDQSFTMNEDGTLTITETQLLAGSADADGDALTVSSIDGVSNGTLVDNGDGSWTFTPDADWNGDLSFSYTVVDGQGGSSTSDLNVTVVDVAEAPVVDSSLFTNGNNNVNLATADSDYGADKIYDAQAGHDTVQGGSLNDTIIGGTGNDRLYGNDGDDVFMVDSNDGWDRFSGGAGEDTVVATDGDDTITTDHFADYRTVETIDAGAGNDTISGSSGNNTLDFTNTTLESVEAIDGGAGHDTIKGSADADTIIGGTGNDRLYGNDGDDVFMVDSNDGWDRFSGGAGEDTVVATDGDDTITTDHFADYRTVETIDAGAGNDTISGSSGNNTLDFTNTTLESVEAIDGGAGHDTIKGSADADTIIGGTGNDRLYGNDGDDVLTGGAGNDRLYGGDGDDLFVWGAGGGNDSVYGGSDWTDMVHLDSSSKGADDLGWQVETDDGETFTIDPNNSDQDLHSFTDSANGTVTDLDTGEVLTFNDIEGIEWG